MIGRITHLKEYTLLKILYWVARIGLGVTFVISGIRKLPGIKFTALSIDNPVGEYFECMYQTGFYWNFIGVFQMIIGILSLFNRTAALAFILMMPVTVNIFLVSVSLGMKGTPVITSAMLLGNIFLMLWHYKNYTNILNPPFH